MPGGLRKGVEESRHVTRVWDEEGATTPHDGAPPRRVRKHVHQGLGGSGLRASVGDWGAQGERHAPGTGGLRARERRCSERNQTEKQGGVVGFRAGNAARACRPRGPRGGQGRARRRSLLRPAKLLACPVRSGWGDGNHTCPPARKGPYNDDADSK